MRTSKTGVSQLLMQGRAKVEDRSSSDCLRLPGCGSDNEHDRRRGNKYGKKQSGFKRWFSSVAFYVQRNKKTLFKVIVVLFCLIVLLYIHKHRQVDVSVELEFETTLSKDSELLRLQGTIEDELASLGVGSGISARSSSQDGFDADFRAEAETHARKHEAAEEARDEMLRGQDSPSLQMIEPKVSVKSNEQAEAAVEEEEETEDATAALGQHKRLQEMTLDELYSNADELRACGKITVPPFVKHSTNWHALRAYSNLYRANPIYACVPHLRPHLQLTLEDFTELFRRNAQPVLFSFENLRSMGFAMRSFSISELSGIFPFDPKKDKKITYAANGKVNSDYLELGPAVHAFKEDQGLVKKKGMRSFPRNMKVNPVALSKLGVELPPLLPNRGKSMFQSPALWFGGSSSPTAFHSDCCDNFVLMLTGTKQFTLAPPTDWHALSPHCIGKRKNLCYANIADPSPEHIQPTNWNKMRVDVGPGQILYLPSGTFHYVYQGEPTLMTNVWTRSAETLGILSCNKKDNH